MSSDESLINQLTPEQRAMVIEKMADFLYKKEKKKKALERLSKL